MSAAAETARVILDTDSPEHALPDTPETGALIQAITDAEPVRRSVRYARDALGQRYVRVELTVRAFTDPASGRRRWAMVLDSDEMTITDFPVKAEAVNAYRDLVTACEAEYQDLRDGHAWHETDTRTPTAAC